MRISLDCQNENDMKTFITTLLVIISLSTFAQENRSTSQRGFEIQLNSNLMHIRTQQKVSADLIDLNGNSFRYDDGSEFNSVGINSDIEFGYRFHEKWSAGVSGGLGIIYNGFFYIIPSFRLTADAGVYGRYHLNERFAITGTLGTRIPPIGNLRKPTFSFSVTPEYVISKKRGTKLRIGLECFYAQGEGSYSFIESNYDYQTQTGGYQLHEGTGPQSTFGWAFEIGFGFPIGE